MNKRKVIHNLFASHSDIHTYTCEMWASTEGDEGKLAIFKLKIPRRIYRHVFHVDLLVLERRKMKIYKDFIINRTFANFLVAKDLEWAGHVWLAKGCLTRKVLVGNLSGKRLIGRPRQRWFYTVERLNTSGPHLKRVNLAVDRMQFRGIVESALDLNRPKKKEKNNNVRLPYKKKELLGQIILSIGFVLRGEL